MKHKRGIMLAFFIFFGLFLIFFVYKSMFKRSVASLYQEKETWHRVIKDSLPYKDGQNIYWFCYNTGVLGYVGDYICVAGSATAVDSAKALLFSEYILSLDSSTNDTIKIIVSKVEYVGKSDKRYRFFLRTAQNYMESKPQRKLLMKDIDIKKF